MHNNINIHSKKADSYSLKNSTTPVFCSDNRLNKDIVELKSKKDICLEKLDNLFPDGEFERIYKDINKDLGIDIPPQIKFYGDDDGVMAGGFTFNKNEISFSLSDLLDSDTKVVGIKDGKRTVLVSPKVLLPVFADKNSIDNFVKLHAQHGNLGFDKLVSEPVTKEEQRKFIIQKVAHELIHAQQHMIMRQTEGIGEKEIIKAWTHEKPANMVEKALLDVKVDYIYRNSVWSKEQKTKQQTKPNSNRGIFAHIWLEAIRNYPKVDSPEYEKNPIEVDAYLRSAKYVINKYGAY